MITTAWRIVKAKYKDSALDGEGARLHGGRWNNKGAPVVYTAGSLALATLELVVNLPNEELLQKYVRIPVIFSSKLVCEIDLTALQDDWTDNPAPISTKLLGDKWVQDRESVILKVPSAIIPEEVNYLINPLHSGFKKIEIGSPVVYFFDPRIKKA